MKKIPTPSLIAALTWLLFCTFLLTIPGEKIPQQNWLDKIWADKWVHLGLFSILVWFWCAAIVKQGKQVRGLRSVFITITIIGILYGVLMEFVQRYLVANRSFDAGDIIADSLGCIIGYLFSTRLYLKK